MTQFSLASRPTVARIPAALLTLGAIVTASSALLGATDSPYIECKRQARSEAAHCEAGAHDQYRSCVRAARSEFRAAKAMCSE